MKPKEFFDAVVRMREKQREYFKVFYFLFQNLYGFIVLFTLKLSGRFFKAAGTMFDTHSCRTHTAGYQNLFACFRVDIMALHNSND